MDKFRVAVKSFIVENGKVLAIKRASDDVHKPNVWEIPGGRLEIGEDPREGVKRETKEEVGLDIDVLLPFSTKSFQRDDGQMITMIIFLCKPISNKIVLSEEHSDFEWIPLSESKEKLVSFFHSDIDTLNISLNKILFSKDLLSKKQDKLVRDKIPYIIHEEGQIPFFYKASKKEYERRLKEKLREEVEEFLEEINKEGLADVEEILNAFYKFYKLDRKEIKKLRKEKHEKRGGFRKGIILNEVKDKI